MKKLNPQSAGGQATAKKLRAEALSTYYNSPNICKHCKEVIQVPKNVQVCAIRLKKYCNRKCYSNYRKNQSHVTNCGRCDVVLTRQRLASGKLSKIKYCKACFKPGPRESKYASRTKQEMIDKHGYRNAMGQIRYHSRITYKQSGRPLECAVCSYSSHFQVAHISPIPWFKDKALVSEINSLDNLVALCPNHHWEFDNGLISTETIRQKMVAEVQNRTEQ